MEQITISAIFRDAATEGITRLESSLNRVGSRLSALNTEMGSRSQTLLTGFKSNLSQLDSVVDGLGKKFDGLIDKLGDKMWSATKKGVIGVVGLTAALGTMGLNIEKEVQNAQLTLSNFMRMPQDSPQVQSMLGQMKSTAWIASLTTQTAGMQQLLVNPAFRGNAQNVEGAVLALAARNPAQSETIFSNLTSTIGRAEQLGRMNPRGMIQLGRAGVSSTDLAAQMGIDLNSSPEAARAFQQVVSQTMTVGQFQKFLVDTAQKYAGYNGPGGMSTSEKAYYNTIGGAESYAKNAVSLSVDDALKSMNFAGIIQQMIGTDPAKPGPLLQMVHSFSENIVPPMMKLFQGLLQVGNRLMPIIGPLVGDFFGKIGDAIGKLAGNKEIVNTLMTAGRQIGRAFSSFMTAAIPLLPAFMNALLALLPVLPPFIQVATLAMWPLARILDAISKLAAVVTANQGVADTIAGIAVSLVAIAGISKVKEIMDSATKWMESVRNAEGFWSKLRALTGIGGGKMAGQEVAQSTVAEMTVKLMTVQNMLRGIPGEPGGPSPTTPAAETAGSQALKTAAQRALGGRPLAPATTAANASRIASGGGTVDDIVSQFAGGMGEFGPLGVAAIVASGTSYFANAPQNNQTSGWNADVEKLSDPNWRKDYPGLSTKYANDPKSWQAWSKAVTEAPLLFGYGTGKGGDPKAQLQNPFAPGTPGAGGYSLTPAQARAYVAANPIVITGPITVVANDPVSLQKGLAAKAADAQRRGARQAPYDGSINAGSQLAQQNRPSSSG